MEKSLIIYDNDTNHYKIKLEAKKGVNIISFMSRNELLSLINLGHPLKIKFTS